MPPRKPKIQALRADDAVALVLHLASGERLRVRLAARTAECVGYDLLAAAEELRELAKTGRAPEGDDYEYSKPMTCVVVDQ